MQQHPPANGALAFLYLSPSRCVCMTPFGPRSGYNPNWNQFKLQTPWANTTSMVSQKSSFHCNNKNIHTIMKLDTLATPVSAKKGAYNTISMCICQPIPALHRLSRLSTRPGISEFHASMDLSMTAQTECEKKVSNTPTERIQRQHE